LVAASRSEADELLSEFLANHPGDLVLSGKLTELLTGQLFGGKLTAAHRQALQRHGIRPYGKTVRLESSPVRLSVLRNHDHWKTADLDHLRAELAKSVTL
jgi:hypothetical protein